MRKFTIGLINLLSRCRWPKSQTWTAQTEAELTEFEKANREIAKLKHQLKMAKMENEFKKITETRKRVDVGRTNAQIAYYQRKYKQSLYNLIKDCRQQYNWNIT